MPSFVFFASAQKGSRCLRDLGLLFLAIRHNFKIPYWKKIPKKLSKFWSQAKISFRSIYGLQKKGSKKGVLGFIFIFLKSPAHVVLVSEYLSRLGLLSYVKYLKFYELQFCSEN